MNAISSDGTELSVRGEGMRQGASTFLGERYTAMKPFSGQTFVDANVRTDFVIEVLGSNEDLQDRLELTYDTVKCTCADWTSL